MWVRPVFDQQVITPGRTHFANRQRLVNLDHMAALEVQGRAARKEPIDQERTSYHEVYGYWAFWHGAAPEELASVPDQDTAEAILQRIVRALRRGARVIDLNEEEDADYTAE